ncbi:MAG: AcvB/VirJ family lysyl-phosphatidylglycerol hydrolase [Dokdonella sp.]
MRPVVSRMLALALFACAPVCADDSQPSYGMFGQLHVHRPEARVDEVVMLLSDRDGFSARTDGLATALAEGGALVVGIDLPGYLKRLEAIGDSCSYPAAHFEELAHWFERHEGIVDYRQPLVVGDGSGATFAYAMAAQAPAGTFSGLITLGWDWTFRLTESICPGDVGAMTAKATDTGFAIVPVSELPLVWLPQPFAVGASLRGSSHLFDRLVTAVKALFDLPIPADADVEISRTLASWSKQENNAKAVVPEDLADLPLVEVEPASKQNRSIAVILTGDGGWAGLDKGVAAALAADGIRVVGLSTLKYFWEKRSPEQAASVLQRILTHYSQLFPDSRFVIVGYSFGASMVPLLINRLPSGLRQKVDSGIMISPDSEAAFEIHIGDWLGNTHDKDALPVLPDISRSTVPLVCIHGVDEDDSFCKPGLDAKLRVLTLPGGHHYDGNFGELGRVILEATKTP